ncbi:T9SS type A sorting domain-containing protein [Saccharicrinis sp. FJH62]|uniref:T9SS type A sorting domain-containing protein n=1 Tax=Saccharicrinis sp. FJH62 TaxID=3344657 RepID=UPI0035D52587
MKKNVLLFAFIFVAGFIKAQVTLPPTHDLSGILTDAGFTWDISYLNGDGTAEAGENGIKGTVGDFNADGIDDFILTGLHGQNNETGKLGYFRVYEGSSTGAPTLAYSNDEFPIAGNGAVDCYLQSDGSYLVAVQGGALGNWTNPFKAMVFKLSKNALGYSMEVLQELDFGAGRGSILFLDIDGDGYVDIFQNGWDGVDTWVAQANVYLNDTENYFILQDESGITPAANLFTVKGDVDNDGDLDLAMAIQGASGGAYVYINDGSGVFQEKLIMAFDEATLGGAVEGSDDASQVMMVDFNNDKQKDIIVTVTGMFGEPWNFFFKIFKNNGDGTFTELEHKNKAGEATTLYGGQRSDYAVADFDGDGNEDILFGGENALDGWKCKTYMYLGNGEGGYDQFDVTDVVVPMSRRGNFGRYLTGDFNGDKKTDVVAAGADYYGNNSSAKVFYGNGMVISPVQKTEVYTPTVFTSGNTVIVENEHGASVEIISLSGKTIRMSLITSEFERITLNEKGIYLVKTIKENKTGIVKVTIF